MNVSAPHPEVGRELVGEPYALNEAEAHAYAAAIERPAERHPRPSIHNDPQAARKAGFRAPIAAGEQSYALVANFLVDRFGVCFLHGGKLEAIFLKPVFYGQRLTVHARVLARGRSATELEVWVENEDCDRVLTGKASVPDAEHESELA
jgi:acyl dehydratase